MKGSIYTLTLKPNDIDKTFIFFRATTQKSKLTMKNFNNYSFKEQFKSSKYQEKSLTESYKKIIDIIAKYNIYKFKITLLKTYEIENKNQLFIYRDLLIYKYRLDKNYECLNNPYVGSNRFIYKKKYRKKRRKYTKYIDINDLLPSTYRSKEYEEFLSLVEKG